MDTSKIPTSLFSCFFLPPLSFFFCWVTTDNLIHTWYCVFFRFLHEPVCLFKQVAGTEGAKKCCFWKRAACVYVRGRACLCVRERGRVCAVSGLAIEPCQTPRAKPSLLDRNCLFTGYTTVYLKTIGLAGLLQRTPCRYRYQASGSCFTTCLLCAIFFFPFFRIASFIWNFIWYFGVQHGYLVCTISNERFVRKPVESQAKTVQSYLFSHLNRFDRKLI